MADLYEDFVVVFTSVWKKLAEAIQIEDSGFPEHRKYNVDMFRNIPPEVLSQNLLCSDLFFVIRQGLAADKVIKNKEIFLVSNLVSHLSSILGKTRDIYSGFKNIPNDKTLDFLNFWHQDPDLFGYMHLETRFLFQDLAAHFSLKYNYPELFNGYKNLILGIYNAILKQDEDSEQTETKLPELLKKLNRVFAKSFHRQAVQTLVAAKIATPDEAKRNFAIESIASSADLLLRINTIHEKRETFELCNPDLSGMKFPSGKSAAMQPPDSVLLPENYTLDAQSFDIVVQESRRVSICNTCNGMKHLHCPDCNKKGKITCNNCVTGKISCKKCDGTGDETYSDSFEKIVPCKHCDRGIITQKNTIASLLNTVIINKGMDIPLSQEATKSKCTWCKGLGFIQQTTEKSRTRPCLYCSTSGKVKCQICDGTAIVPCITCATEGKVCCEICDGIGRVEFQQIIKIHRFPVFSETRLFTTTRKLKNPVNKNLFTKFATVNDKNLSQRILIEPLNRTLSDNYRKSISRNIGNDWFKNAESKAVYQGCELLIYNSYKIRYSFHGYSGEIWWHPLIGEANFSLEAIMNGLLKTAIQNIQANNYFEAAKKTVLAENLSKNGKECLEKFKVFYAKQSLFMKFLIYIARHFVNPESIW